MTVEMYAEDRGRAEGIEYVALNMIRDGQPLDVIHKYTNLSPARIDELVDKVNDEKSQSAEKDTDEVDDKKSSYNFIVELDKAVQEVKANKQIMYEYIRYQKSLSDSEERGRVEGIEFVAEKMIKAGVAVEKIQAVTELSAERVEEIANNPTNNESVDDYFKDFGPFEIPTIYHMELRENREHGHVKGIEFVAGNMIRLQMSVNEIRQFTKLSKKRLNELVDELQKSDA